MSREEQVEKLTAYMANFIGYTAKVLPDDVIAKLDELAEREDGFLPKVIYQTMKKNQKLAKELDRPSCQDTGVLQFWVKCGTAFPLKGSFSAEVCCAGASGRAQQKSEEKNGRFKSCLSKGRTCPVGGG